MANNDLKVEDILSQGGGDGQKAPTSPKPPPHKKEQTTTYKDNQKQQDLSPAAPIDLLNSSNVFATL